MRTKNNKLAAIFLVLALTGTCLVMAVPTVRAAIVTTSAKITASPNPDEPGQTITIIGDINPNPPSGYYFYGVTFTIATPDGGQQTFGPYTTNAIGSVTIAYVPSMVGNHTVAFYYPGEIMPYNDYYTGFLAGTSFDVQYLDPVASFEFSPEFAIVDQIIDFNGSSSYDPSGGYFISYYWLFGDGDTGYGVTQSHTYSSAGTYTVNLTVMNNHNITDTNSQEITITSTTSNTSPIASFTSTHTSPSVNQSVTFDASNSTDPDGIITNYIWDFGDDTTGAGMTTTHSYITDGTYTVTLTVTDNNGLTDTIKQTLSDVIPEFTSLIILPLCLTSTLVILILKKKLNKKAKTGNYM